MYLYHFYSSVINSSDGPDWLVQSHCDRLLSSPLVVNHIRATIISTCQLFQCDIIPNITKNCSF